MDILKYPLNVLEIDVCDVFTMGNETIFTRARPPATMFRDFRAVL
mgnify:CR=1 FL=1